jgi:hypothetical protein
MKGCCGLSGMDFSGRKILRGDLGSGVRKAIKILFLPYGQKYLEKDFHPINPANTCFNTQSMLYLHPCKNPPAGVG